VATLALVVGLITLIDSLALEGLLFPVGTLAVFIGFGLYGPASLQGRVLPSWCGIGFIVGPFMFPVQTAVGNSRRVALSGILLVWVEGQSVEGAKRRTIEA
jgi:hypothetical protein